MMRTADILHRGLIALVSLGAMVAVPLTSFAEDRLRDTQITASAGSVAYSVSIPAIQSGSSLTADRLNALISTGSLAELQMVRAERISIPSMSVTAIASGQVGNTLAVFNLTDIVFDNLRHGRAATVSIGSITLETPWGSSKLDNFAARNVDLLAELSRYGMTPELRRGIALEDVSFSLPHPAHPGRGITIGILNLEASLAAFHNGVPTSLDVEGIGLTFDLPADLDNPMLAVLRAGGLHQFNGTFRAAAEWNESQDTISIVETSVTGRELGAVTLTGEITKAGKALFSTDPAEAQAALSNLAVKFVTASILDSGLRDLLAGSMAKSDNGDAGEQRAVLARVAAQVVLGILYSSDHAGVVGAAVKRFIAGGSKGIAITAQAKTDPGIDMIDLPDIKANLPALLQRVRIDAEPK